MTPSFLAGLNEQQLEAVTLPHQSALVLAGAGSGKTRVLTTRIAWLIHTAQASPAGLLAVTFTNKAAKEMLTRISSMLPINTRGMWVGTFHGLCNRLLRTHHREANLPQLFQILDTQDQLALIKRLLKSLNIDEERYPPRQAQWFIADNKEEGRRAANVEVSDDFSRRMRDVYAAYDEQCQREGVVDFAELLLRAFELLSRNEELREHYRNRFGHILVDEFQDTNRLQYRWLQMLAGPDNAVFAVGDDDQSIYAFRGASAANMQDLQRDFGIERVIKLEQNYRSHGHILDAANALIQHNRRRLGKNLWTDAGKGEPLRLFEADTDLDEAAYIVDEVKALHAQGIALDQLAVLYRSNAQSRVLEHALFNAGISYRVFGGLRFFERQEVKHALAYLRLVASDADDGALLRVINFPPRGIGARTLEQVQDLARERGLSLWEAARGKAVMSAERRMSETSDAPATAGSAHHSSFITHHSAPARGVPAFVALIESMRVATRGLQLPEVIDHVIEASGMKQHYRTEKEGADRLENLAELVTAATTFVAERDVQPAEVELARLATAQTAPAADAAAAESPRNEDDTLVSFLAHAALEAGEHQAEAGADALQLMTAHSAKGLEFYGVFVSGLEEGLFPHENSLTEVEGLEEERRLMYVALTRARRRLYLSLAGSRMLHGQTRYGIASRFLHEIPASLVRRVSTGFRRRNAGTRGQDSGFRGKSAEPAVPFTRHPAPGTRHSIPWRIGQSVMHPKFGAGVIVGAEGRGPEARVQVNFRDSGLKWLMLEYAKLAAA